MNTDQLETFIKLAEIGTYSKTAELLNITQPAVTARIRNLEAELGCKLFIMNGRRASLSEAGELFLGYAKNLLNQFADAKKSIGQLKEPRLSIGFPPNFTNHLITKIVSLSNAANMTTHIYRAVDSN
ncbi:LysR family transcriptional regulator, partial [Kyrpidia sp.]|uniref:LysR family transcriptional regulator n=1 Tax=Kyrpidia sp. TaxID=2073077 RepID=UPI00258FA8B1